MDERVQEGDECPECGENRIDWLVWLDDETVECQACETQYAVFPADWTATHEELASGAITHVDSEGNLHYGMAYEGCAICKQEYNDAMVAPDGTIAPGYWQDHSANMGVGN